MKSFRKFAFLFENGSHSEMEILGCHIVLPDRLGWCALGSCKQIFPCNDEVRNRTHSSSNTTDIAVALGGGGESVHSPACNGQHHDKKQAQEPPVWTEAPPSR
jgi:hypothetical protein